jgi:phage tail-like protein
MPGEMIQYLPAIYQVASDHSLLAHLLAAFETILLHKAGQTSGLGAAETRQDHAAGKGEQPAAPGVPRLLDREALEDVISDLAKYFDPMRTDRHFLPWLAGWVALSLRADLSESRKREVIARIVPLYGRRGTPGGMKELVELFTEGTVNFEEPQDIELQIRDHSTIGKDTWLGGPPPHVFHARFAPPQDGSADREECARRHQLNIEIARWAIEMAKPAHTWYTLEVLLAE